MWSSELTLEHKFGFLNFNCIYIYMMHKPKDFGMKLWGGPGALVYPGTLSSASVASNPTSGG